MKIYLVDNANDGHHKVYQDTLNKINNTQILNKIIKFTDLKENFIKAYKERSTFFKYVNSKTNKGDIIHLLYIDSLYKCPLIDKKLNRDKKYIGTLHWVPKDAFRQNLLKRFSKKIELIIVHSEFLEEELNKIGIKNVKTIEYPSFININNKNIKKDKELKDKIVISCLGGTRKDKGLDILSEAFKFIDSKCKEKIVFNICGIEQDIKYDDIMMSAKENNIDVICKNKFLTEQEYEEEIYKTDVILLPYRKIFSGNSGPMTDGIYANKFILGPNEGNLGFLINKYQLGDTFVQEDYKDLAKKISEINKLNLNKEHEYRDRLKSVNFLNLHAEIYNKIKNFYMDKKEVNN